MIINYRIKLFWGVLVVIVLGLVVSGGQLSAADTEPELVDVEPEFYGYPLKIFRVLEAQHPYPESTGLFVTEVDPESPAGLARLEPEQIIKKIDGVKINQMDQVFEIVNRNPGEKLKFEGYRLRPSYIKRRREDPFFDFRGSEPYRRFEYEISYPRKYVPEPQPVIVHPEGQLYHKTGFGHSPDTSTGKVIESSEKAREMGYRPCPFCFPGEADNDQQVTELLDDQIPISSGVAAELQDEFGVVEELDPELERLISEIFPQRLRSELDPQIVFLDTNIFYGFGLPTGEIVISRGLWEFLEFEKPRAFLLVTLLGHLDLQHWPGLPGEEYLFSTIRRWLDRLTRQISGLDLGHLERFEQMLPAYIRASYRGIMEHGYSVEEERRAYFMGLVYLHRADLDMEAVESYLVKARDIHKFPQEGRLSYRLQRPFPSNIEKELSYWKDLIPDQFGRDSESHPGLW